MVSNQFRKGSARKLFHARAYPAPTLKALGVVGVLALIHDAFRSLSNTVASVSNSGTRLDNGEWTGPAAPCPS